MSVKSFTSSESSYRAAACFPSSVAEEDLIDNEFPVNQKRLDALPCTNALPRTNAFTSLYPGTPEYKEFFRQLEEEMQRP